jgi:hypothetical protein
MVANMFVLGLDHVKAFDLVVLGGHSVNAAAAIPSIMLTPDASRQRWESLFILPTPRPLARTAHKLEDSDMGRLVGSSQRKGPITLSLISLSTCNQAKSAARHRQRST